MPEATSQPGSGARAAAPPGPASSGAAPGLQPARLGPEGVADQPGSITNGWDAVCAYDLQQINGALFQQYLTEAPMAPQRYVRVGCEFPFLGHYALTTSIGPPELTFVAGAESGSCQVSMYITGGLLARIEPGPDLTLQSVVQLVPGRYQITGSVSLSQVTEQDTGGQVLLELGQGNLTVQLPPMPDNDATSFALGLALQYLFEVNTVTYELAGVQFSAQDLTSALVPQDFSFSTQLSTDGSACLVLLIRTDGNGGQQGPLPVYPIPDGATAAVVVADRVLFDALLPAALFSGLLQYGEVESQVQGQQSGALWQTTATGGSLRIADLGPLTVPCQDPDSGTITLSTVDLAVPVSFTVAAQDGSLAVVWNASWSQPWDYVLEDEPGNTFLGNQEMSVGASFPLTATVDGESEVVTFTGSPEPSVGFVPPYTIASFGANSAAQGGSTLSSAVQPSFKALFQSQALPAVSVFALGNLLLPYNILTLSQVGTPEDLVLAGSVVPQVEVTPAQTTLAPGQSQQYAYTLPPGQTDQGVVWTCSPQGFGEITQEGVYTAPRGAWDAGDVTTVVIGATSKADLTLAGSAMVLVGGGAVGPGGVQLDPAGVVLLPGQSMNFYAQVAGGGDQSVTWSCAPAGVGQLTGPAESGEPAWYTAPGTITAAQTVTITATSSADPTLSGASTVTLAPPATVTVTPGATTLAAGETVQLAVAVEGDAAPAVSWVVTTPGRGSVSESGLYTAPSSVLLTETVSVIALYVNPPVGAGAGGATVTITSSWSERSGQGGSV